MTAGAPFEPEIECMDPEARREPGQVVRDIWRLRRSPFTRLRVIRQLFQYNQRGFHPDDRDTSALIAEWRGRLFGTEGELRELLAS